jgi:large subunit ribosomal protein L15
VVTPELLREAGLIHSMRQPIKVLARGDVSKKLTVQAHKFSGKAAEKIQAAGGATHMLVAGK